MYKICSKCKIEKETIFFSKKSNNKDGLRSECKACYKEYYEANKSRIIGRVQAYREENKSRIAEQKKDYLHKNKEMIARYRQTNKIKHTAVNKTYREENKSRIAEQKKEYAQTNRAKIRSINAKRRATKLKATPSWLTKEDFAEIEEFYICAQMFKLYTGEDFHVDHIVPLQGNTVCGLHVPWNLQVLPARENISKSNKLLE